MASTMLVMIKAREDSRTENIIKLLKEKNIKYSDSRLMRLFVARKVRVSSLTNEQIALQIEKYILKGETA